MEASWWGPHHGMKSQPILCFGQRLKQGESRKFPDPTPLGNLWLTMLRACGVEAASFADSTGALDDIQSKRSVYPLRQCPRLTAQRRRR
jgi:hypothetical protein